MSLAFAKRNDKNFEINQPLWEAVWLIGSKIADLTPSSEELIWCGPIGPRREAKIAELRGELVLAKKAVNAVCPEAKLLWGDL